MDSKKQAEANVSSIAIAALRFITPLLLSILTWNGVQLVHSVEKVTGTMQELQITIAKISEKMDGYDRNSVDYEVRIRDLEKRVNTLENQR